MRKSIFMVILSLIIFTSTIFSSKILIEKSKNPVFKPSQGQQAKNPCVVYDQSGFESTDPAASYKMWFATEDGIALAYSVDGLAWTEYNYSQPLSDLQPTANQPYVIYDKDSFSGTNYYYRIWYLSKNNNSAKNIRTAESRDGITWENDSPIQQLATDLSLQFVMGIGSVLYNPNGSDSGSLTPTDKSDDQPMTYHYVMYFNSSNDSLSPEGSSIQISLAYSIDGLYWIKYEDKPVISPLGSLEKQNAYSSFDAKVIQSNGKYLMWFSYLNANSESPLNASIVKTAYSNDGINWTIDQNAGSKLKKNATPVNNSVQGCSIIKITSNDNSKYSIWASVKDDTGRYSINYYEQNIKELPGGESKGIYISSSKGYAPFTFVAWIEQQDWDHELTCYVDEMYWQWNFDDGSGQEGYDAWTVQHTYEKPGTYTITATNFCQGIYDFFSDTQIVEVLEPPFPCFTVQPEPAFAPVTITFDSSCTQVPSSLSIVSYFWSFGDGQEGSFFNPQHVYALPGTYNIILKVTDNLGHEYTYSSMITVKGLFAPSNITLERQIIRSLFKGTAKNVLKWTPNALIFECTVVKYNIYRKLSSQPDTDYQLIGSVNGDTYSFTDENIELNGAHTYVLTAVETGGHESSYSNPVAN